MFNHKHYVPVLKWKRGERSALSLLSDEEKASLTPLFEINPIPYDHQKREFKKTLDGYLGNFGADLSSCLSAPKQIFIDAHTIHDDGRLTSNITLENGLTPLEYTVNEANNSGFTAVPVTSLRRYDEYHTAARNCVQNHPNGIALRIFRSDLENLSDFNNNLNSWIEFMNLNTNEVDIILDFQYVNPEEESNFLNLLSSILVRFPYLSEWRTLTLLYTSMPQNLSSIKTGTNTQLPRIEWNIYAELMNFNLTRIPTYGDYNIASTEWFDFDPVTMNPGANIKYTTPNQFLIFRGHGTRNNGLGQMQGLCTDLVQHNEYYGPDFSYGDQYISECSMGNVSTGNPETWVKVTVNHHLVFILHLLPMIHSSEANDLVQ